MTRPELMPPAPARPEMAEALDWLSTQCVLFDDGPGAGVGEWRRIHWEPRNLPPRDFVRYGDETVHDFLLRSYREARTLPVDPNHFDLMRGEMATISICDVPDRWFAWYPVKLSNGHRVWLQTVRRWRTFYSQPERGIQGSYVSGYDAL